MAAGTRTRARAGSAERDGAPHGADENRAEVLRAAAIAFMAHGYAATSIDTVADALGATKGRVYYYYRSKTDLFFDIHRQAMTMNLSVMRPLASSARPPRDRLVAMARAHATLVMDHLPTQRVLNQGVELHLSGRTTAPQRDVLDELMAMRSQFERLYVDVLAEGVASGDFRVLDPRLGAKSVLGALNWMTVWYSPRPDESPETRDRIADELATFVLHAVQAAL
ncbi:transcriptional regulator, TetR family [Methylobacterium sp. ap11]|uniref:TetR/AcrR family transcriptional regulator n=1 Tax=Methylobacterium sp. ap11 TaxID=1761799 RepID=UPI0008B55933|nr:TetR/AcrR family transcriptional regulator [Methylobacterium sp. ap11]SEP28498.1 transcriptional regulator, TetR family [Methylobacterium sp. ap11]